MLDLLTMTFIVINQFKITIRRLQYVRKQHVRLERSFLKVNISISMDPT